MQIESVRAYDDIEFITTGGMTKYGTISSIMDDIIYVMPDGFTRDCEPIVVEAGRINRVIPIPRCGKKTVIKTDPHHFTQAEYCKRERGNKRGISEDQFPAGHRIFVEMALEAGKAVTAEVLADYPELQYSLQLQLPICESKHCVAR